MSVSDAHSTTQDPTTDDQADVRQLFRLIADNFSKEELGSLVLNQEYKQYHTMANDGSPISIIHSLPPSSFDVQGFAQFFNPSHTRTLSDGPLYTPQHPTPHTPTRMHQQFKSHASSVPRTQPENWPTMPPTPAKMKTPAFACNFCLEEGLTLACTRKNDLKRHIEDFHHTNSQWLCPIPDCGMVFDWESAFKAHTKTQHESHRIKPATCKVPLCEQVVFACGFETCMQVFESASDSGAPAIFKEYLSHVIKHYDEGLSSGQWSYSRRMRNLLRQSAMHRAWSSMEESEGIYQTMQWNPQTSNILRKKLETRHIEDVKIILDAAIDLGWLPDKPQQQRHTLLRPLRNECAMAIIGHAHVPAHAHTHPHPHPHSHTPQVLSPLHALPLSMSPPVHYANPQSTPQYYTHPENSVFFQPHQAMYTPQSPMYVTSNGPGDTYSPMGAEYGASFQATSPGTPLYKTLPQMMHEDERAHAPGMSIDPQLYMDWTTPECEAFPMGSPVVKREGCDMDEDLFPPLEDHA